MLVFTSFCRILKKPDDSGLIYTPVMDILYAERNVDGVSSSSSSALYARPQVGSVNFLIAFCIEGRC
jgi:hypothetical protein